MQFSDYVTSVRMSILCILCNLSVTFNLSSPKTDQINCYNIDSNIVEQSRHLPNGQDVYDAVIDWQPPSEQIYKVGRMARVDMYVFLK